MAEKDRPQAQVCVLIQGGGAEQQEGNRDRNWFPLYTANTAPPKNHTQETPNGMQLVRNQTAGGGAALWPHTQRRISVPIWYRDRTLVRPGCASRTWAGLLPWPRGLDLNTPASWRPGAQPTAAAMR